MMVYYAAIRIIYKEFVITLKLSQWYINKAEYTLWFQLL